MKNCCSTENSLSIADLEYLFANYGNGPFIG